MSCNTKTHSNFADNSMIENPLRSQTEVALGLDPHFAAFNVHSIAFN